MKKGNIDKIRFLIYISNKRFNHIHSIIKDQQATIHDKN